MTVRARITRWLYSIGGRLFISHILVGALTPLLIALLLALFTLSLAFTFTPRDYRTFAENVAVLWMLPDSDAATFIRDSETTSFTPPGYAIIADSAGRVVFVHKVTSCGIGEMIQTCIPHFVDLPVGETLTDFAGERWIDIHLPLSTGDRVLARFATPTIANITSWLTLGLTEILVAVVQIALTVTVISIPISAILVGIFARPLLRRVGHIAESSQHFADGDLSARVRDTGRDEVSTLARQFDTMADVLQQNIATLRDLLKSNVELTAQVEQSAIQGERLRLARDLHDELAQQLFSLSVASATLPDMIMHDAQAAQVQARQVAQLAEKTLVGLRSLLVDLRPGGLLDMGLAPGLKALCAEWERDHQLAIELSIMIVRERFSAPLQNAAYQIVRESLSNIAKHAQATQVNVTLVEGRNQLVVSITDDGLGLRPNDLRKEGHFGMVNMRERAEALGGALFVESESRQGTTIRAVLPLAGLIVTA